MTEKQIQEQHALAFFREQCRYLSEDSVFQIESSLKDYQIKNRKSLDFKYQDELERNVLESYLINNDIIVFKENEPIIGRRLFQLTEKGKTLLKENQKRYSY